MKQFGLLDGPLSPPMERFMSEGLWIPILVATLVVGALIVLFIKMNRDKKNKKGNES